jgi:alpha-glucosidase
MFVKAGTILPLYPVMQHTNEKPIDELTLNIYYKNGREVSELYEDRGEGMEYQMGIYSLKTFEFQANDKGMILEQHQKGTFKLAYKKAILHFFGFPIDVTMIQVDGETVEKSENGFVVKAGFGKVVVRF